MSKEPTPELVVQLADECERLLESLGDDTLRHVAIRRLEGYRVDEIAAELGVAERTVGRKLHRIRREWVEVSTP